MDRTNLAELHRRVVFGQSGGRIIWQPRIQCWLSDKLFAGEALPAPYTGLTTPLQLYRALNREAPVSARVYSYNKCFRRVEHPSVRTMARNINSTDVETVIDTPAGRQTMITRSTGSAAGKIWVKREISTREELRAAAWRHENTTWEWDQTRFDELQRDWGDLGAATMYMPRINVQDLYVVTMGVEQATFALCDWPDEIEAYFKSLEESHDRLIDVINASPVDIINFGDNVHSGTLSPSLFRKYVLPACQRRCEKLHRAGKFVSAHWDGDTRPLLPFARETGLDGIEAITPRPQGDVTLDEIKAGLGDKMFLLDGIPAVYFDRTFTLDELDACVRRLIELFAPRLVLGISDEISSTGDMARVLRVARTVEEYNARQPTPSSADSLSRGKT